MSRKLLCLAMALVLAAWAVSCPAKENTAKQPGKTQQHHQTLAKSLDALADGLIGDLSPGQVKNIAVFDPTGPGKGINGFSIYLVEQINRRLTSASSASKYLPAAANLGGLLGTKYFAKVLERRQLYEIISQQRIEFSTHYDQGTVTPLGKKVGVDGLVFLTIHDVGDSLLISAKLDSVATGQMLSGSEVTITKTPLVKAMLDQTPTANLTVLVDPPINGAEIKLGDKTLPAEPTGSVFSGTCQGMRNLLVTAPCAEPYRLSFYLAGDRTMNVHIEPKRTQLHLVVKPSDAKVLLDSKDTLTLDATGSVITTLPAGRHTIVVMTQEKEPLTRIIDLGCSPRTVSIDMERGKKKLNLAVSPPDANVSLNGEAITLGSGGKWQDEVYQGTYNLVASAPGYEQLKKAVNVDRDLALSLALKPLQYELSIGFQPKNATVLLDGMPMAAAGQFKASGKVAPGNHELTVQAHGYKTVDKAVDINGDTELSFELEPLPIKLEMAAICEDGAGQIKPLQNGDTLHSNQNYALSLRPNIDAWVYVFQLDSRGAFTQIFPNHQISPLSNPLKAGSWSWLPSPNSWLYLDNNTGKEKIFIVVARQDDEVLAGLAEELRKATGGSQSKMMAATRGLAKELRSRGVAGVRPAQPARMNHSGRAFENANSVINSCGAGEVYTLEFDHR